jgi:hypothetical protein
LLCGLATEKRKTGVAIDTLVWLPANRFVEGIQYDATIYNLYPVKTSLKPYRNLIHASGLNVVRQVESLVSPESTARHSDTILQSLQEMCRSEDLCDMTIIIGGRKYYVHLIAMSIFCGFFRPLMASPHQWEDIRKRILDLDGRADPPTSSTPGVSAKEDSYATVESVAAVIDWVYKGRLNIDDSIIRDDDSALSKRLDDYLDILQLADVGVIPSLKSTLRIASRGMQRSLFALRM